MDRSLEEIGGIARVPFAVTRIEFELHEMANDGGEEHFTGLVANGVVELEDLVVTRTTVSPSNPWVP